MRVLTTVVTLFGVACATPSGPDEDPGGFDYASVDVAPGGAADGAGVVQDLALGAESEGTLTPYEGRDLESEAQTLEDIAGHVDVYRLAVEPGQPFAVLVESTGGDLDPYLVSILDLDRTTVHEQGVLPIAAEGAALLATTGSGSGKYSLFVGDRSHDDHGSYRIRAFALEQHSMVDLTIRSGDDLWDGRRISIQAATRQLRDREPDLVEMLIDGRLAETAEGLVTDDTPYWDVPGRLAERAAARGLANAVNGDRGELFRFLVGPAPDDPRIAHAGEVLAELWAAVGRY